MGFSQFDTKPVVSSGFRDQVAQGAMSFSLDESLESEIIHYDET